MELSDPVVIVGVDPGVTTGIAVILVHRKANRWELMLRSEVGDVRDGGGLYNLLCRVRALLHSDHRYPVAACAMEQLLSYTNSAQEKAEAQGIIRAAVYAEMVTLHCYAPTSIRATAVGSGRAKAGDVAKVMRDMAGLQRTKKGEAFSVHQQDALAAALCCAVGEGFLKSLEPQEETREESQLHQEEPKRKHPAH